MKKKNKWIILIIFVLVVVLVSGIFGARFVWKMLNPEPVVSQNYYKNAFMQPNTILNRCGGGESSRNYYFDVENSHESVSIWINTITNEGEVTYFIDGERVVKNRAIHKDGYIYVYTDDSQNPVELVSGLPYQLFEYGDFKITDTFTDITDHHGEWIYGEITPDMKQSSAQQDLLVQLKEIYNFDMNVEDIQGMQMFETEYVADSMEYESIYFTTNINDLTMTEACSRR